MWGCTFETCGYDSLPVLMGWAGNSASFPSTFSGSLPGPCGWALTSRGSPCSWKSQNISDHREFCVAGLFVQISTCHPLFTSTRLIKLTPFAICLFSQQAKRAGCVDTCGVGHICSISLCLCHMWSHPILAEPTTEPSNSLSVQYLPWNFERKQLHACHFSISQNRVIELESNVP